MPLEVHITKKLADFALEVAFSTGDSPLSILGPSGAGKSMLLRCIAGLEAPDRGRIVLNERPLFDSEKRLELAARERRVGMLFQHYALFPHYTLAENIAFGLRHLPAAERGRRVRSLLDRMHLAGLEARFPHEVSGGEQQRAALARALAIEPQALALDEPLSALDTHLRSQMEAQLQEAFESYARPSLLVTHNVEEAYRLGAQLLVLSRGKVVAFGDKDEVFLNPPSLEVARLTGCKNFSRARPIDRHHIEALDWKCSLRVSGPVEGPLAHVGIRAHHIQFPASDRPEKEEQNSVPSWLTRASETPFGVTIYLHLHEPPARSGEYHLQAEVNKQRWQQLRKEPLPWQIVLSAEALFLVPD